MSRAVGRAGLALISLTGCLPPFTEPEFGQVPTSPFPPSVTQTVKRANTLNYAPADPDLGWRVDAVGRKLLAANPQTRLTPLFAAIGAPTPEIFHVDQTVVYV